jgi:hypothetical protein
MSGYRKNKRFTEKILAIFLLAMLLPIPGSSQMEWSGDIAVTLKGLDRHLTENQNNRQDDPFNEVRLRLFPRHWINERMAFLGELFWDSGAQPRVNGAYIVINHLLSKTWLNLKAGLIPSPFGNYGLRSTYFNLNSVIGIPLMWHYQTHIPRNAYPTNATLLDGKYTADGYVPIAYDACWDIGWELFGEWGKLEYSFALTEATLSNPAAKNNNGRQVIAKLGVNPITALRFGLSFAYGPYLPAETANSDTTNAKKYANVEEFAATAAGIYTELMTGRLQMFSEAVFSHWASPFITPDQELTAASGYLEGRYAIAPALYVATRLDFFTYSSIENTQGGIERWGDPINRIEVGAGYRLAREAMLKLVYQYNDYQSRTSESDPQVIALQYHMVF